MAGRFAFRSLAAAASLLAFVGWLAAQNESALVRKPIKRLGSDFLRHGSRILCLSFAPDGKRLYVGGGDDLGRLWNLETGKVAHSLPEPWVHSILIHPDGKSVLGAGPLFGLQAWDRQSGKAMSKLDPFPPNVRTAALARDGSRVALGCLDGSVHLYDVADRKLVKAIKAHPEEITALVFADDGTFASAGGDRMVRWWTRDGEPAREIAVKTVVHALLPIPGVLKFLAAGNDRKVRLWDRVDGTMHLELAGHTQPVVALMLAPDNKTLVSGGRDGTALVWDLIGKTMVRRVFAGWGSGDAFALSPDGKTLAAAGFLSRVKLFEVDSGNAIGEKEPGWSAPIVQGASLDDGRTAVGLAADGSVALWGRTADKPGSRWQTAAPSEQQADFALAVASKQRLAFVAASSLAAVQAWNVDQGKLLYELPAAGEGPILALAASPAGDRLAIGYQSGVAELWDGPAKKKLHAWKTAAPIQAFAFDRTGKLLAIGSRTKIVVADAETGAEIRRMDPRPEAPAAAQPMVASLAFFPDGRTLGMGGFDGIVRLLDATTGKELQACEGARGAIAAIAPSPDGRQFAAASADKTVRLWETFGGSKLAIGQGHEGPLASVDWAADGRSFATSGADGCFLVWDAMGLAPDGSLPAMPLGVADLQARWQELALDDGAKGIRSAWMLVACADSVPFLAKQLYLVDPARIKKLFEDLDHSKFQIRDKASAELERYGRWVEGGLRDIVANPPGPEGRRRAERLLEKLSVPGAITLQQERLRQRRIMFVLEQVGSEAALKALGDLAAGAPEEELRREAAEAAARLRAKKG